MALKVISDQRSLFFCLLLLASLFATSFAAPAQTVAPSTDPGIADQWEVSIAKDVFHHVYLLYSRKESPCLGCLAEPRLQVAIGNDGDGDWEAPRELTPPSFDQVNPALAVDASDQRTVYAVWVERKRRDVLLAKSSDFGRSWSLMVVARADRPASKPVLFVRGENVTIAFSRDHHMWTASSQDGGITFSSAEIEAPVPLLDVLTGDASLDPNGNAYVAWEGYARNAGEVKPQINLYISKSADHGKTWTTTLMDVSNGSSSCTASDCTWGYMGAQIAVASDSAGTLYALWNADSPKKENAERIYFSSSTTAGETWSPKSDVSGAPAGTKHVLPTIMAGTPGEVRIGWMDARNSPRWSAYARSSTNGGATWSAEELLSMYVPNSSYIPPQNFDSFFSPFPENARNDDKSLLNVGGL